MAQNHDVTVAVSGNGNFTFAPNNGDVTVEPGDDSIIIQGANNFTFTGISFDDGDPFCFSVQDHQIVIIDSNENTSGNPITYKYAVSVELNSGATYTSPDPRIINRP